MPIINTTRSVIQTILDYFWPYISLAKSTRLHNVLDQSPTSEAYLGATLINEHLDKIMIQIQRKLLNTEGKKVKLKLTRGETSVLYLQLLKLPLPSEQFFLQQVRNELVAKLDAELQQEALYDQFRTDDNY